MSNKIESKKKAIELKIEMGEIKSRTIFECVYGWLRRLTR